MYGRQEFDKCVKCNYNSPIVNRKFKLCYNCNFKRLHEGLSPYQYNYIKQKGKRLETIKKVKNEILRMEAVYEQVFNNSKVHWCEECHRKLNSIFRDKQGKVIYKVQYSHILPKSCYPQFKYDVKNFNRLCALHHNQWEHGDRHSMRIWKLNVQILVIGEIVLKNR